MNMTTLVYMRTSRHVDAKCVQHWWWRPTYPTSSCEPPEGGGCAKEGGIRVKSSSTESIDLKGSRVKGVLPSCLILAPYTGNTLQHTATHCNTLQHTATHCNTLQHTATHCNKLQQTATHCNTLQHTATHCNTLQHTATHCNTLQQTSTNCNKLQHTARLYNALQHTAAHCNLLQQTATHCNTPPMMMIIFITTLGETV